MTKSVQQLLVTSAIVLVSSFASASVSSQATVGKTAIKTTLSSLDLPFADRIHDLKSQKGAYANLASIAFGKSHPMDVRWKALTALGRLGGASAKADLARAASSPEWFMRNAALVSIAQNDRAAGLQTARKLLSDKALVVRAAAVDVIAGTRDIASAPILWQKLYARENFKGTQSLFIRRRIVEALADMETKGQEAKFIAILQDKDESLHEPAIEGLERITANALGNPGEPVKTRRAHWQQWYSKNKARL